MSTRQSNDPKLFEPRIDSHYDLGALSTNLSEPEMRMMQTQGKAKYKITVIPGPTSAFDINIFGKKSRIIEGSTLSRKIVHETVASLIQHETDVKLHTIGVKHSDGNLSPDYIDTVKKQIVELTTTVNSDPKNAEERFNQKVIHYKDALNGTGYGIGVVFVGETFVYTNLEMSQAMVDSLCLRCRIGIAIKSTIERVIGKPTVDDKSTEKEKIVQDIAFSMKKQATGNRDFPIDDILECRKPPTGQEMAIASKILKRELKESKKKSQINPDVLNKYISDYDSNSRTDMKRVGNIPFIEKTMPNCIEIEMNETDIAEINSPSFLKEIWKASLPVKSFKQSKETAKIEAMMVVDYNQHVVQKNAAFNVKLGKNDLEEASTRGLWGKSQLGTELYRKNREKNKKSFHPIDTPTDDIHNFIMNTSMISKSGFNTVPKQIRSLISEAKSVWHKAETKTISESLFEKIARTRLANFGSMITQIFTEICYCYKYWIGRSDFYLKKVEGIYLLVRCTGTQIFCAFAYPKNSYRSFDTGRLGPALYEGERFIFTDFTSYTEPVVEHFVKAGPYLCSLLTHLICSKEIPLDQDFSTNTDLSRDMNGILLLYANNKTDAEEIMTSQRFLTMTVLEDLDPNPLRFVERLPGFIKSRLSSYLLKRTLSLMNLYKTPPIRMLVKEGGTSVMEYDGLRGIFTDTPITFKKKIEEFYFGYVISKEKGRGGDRNFKIMAKIVMQEYKYVDENRSPFTRHYDTGTNQTNINVLKVLCYFAKHRMEQHYGQNWRDVLRKKIIERLASVNFLETATLKVSSRNYDQDFKIPNVDNTMTTEEIKQKLVALNPDDTAARPRVMESLTTIIEEYKKDTGASDVEHIFQLVPWCLGKIERRGFFYSDIFPKPQHGGDREIHVLEIKARIIQLFVETISRSLCDMIPSDTLMHPKWKSGFVSNHYSRAESELDTYRITVGKSADAAKWCQRNHASKFAAILSSFLPKWLLHPVLRILKLWTTKVICFPIQFVANFIRNKDVKSNPIYERMRSEFFNGTGIFKTPVCNRMTIRSGMMQGILHYTSSFTHGVIQEAMVLMQERLIKKAGLESVISIAQGSDDSAELISLSGKSVKTLIRVATTMLHWKENVSRHLSIYTSRAKSCVGSTDLIEYNSEWYTRKNSIMPTFRWVSSCLEVGIVEKFIDRIHNFYGTATNVIEAGGKILEVAVIQICQAWMHYHLLGLTNNVLANEVSTLISDIQDPALGFFPLDSDYNAGITGVDFQLFKLHKDAEYGYGLGTNRLLDNELELFDEDTRDPTVSQSLRKVKLKFGNHKIFKGLLRRMTVPELEDLLKEVEKNPRILYYPTEHWSESKVRVFMKLFEPGVKESLSRHSPVARILSASAYMINRPCLSVSGSDNKMSLYKALLREFDEQLMGVKVKQPTNKIFLYHDEYLDTLRDIESIQNNNVLQQVNIKSRSKQTIQVFDRVLNDIPVIEMCKQKWFGFGYTGLSLRQFDIKWNELQKRFTFLADSRTETKGNLGMSEIQLKNFIVSIDSKPRRLTMMDTAARGGSVKSAMTRLFWPNIKLLKTNLSVEEEETASSIRSQIFSILTHWASKSEKMKAVNNILLGSTVLNQKTVPTKLRKLKCIREARSTGDKAKVMDMIISEKIGNLGAFTVSQRGWGKNRTGYGEWKGMVHTSNAKIEFYGPVCTKITLSSVSNRSELGRSLLELMRNFSSSFPTNPQESDYWLSTDGVINGGKGIMSAVPIVLDHDLKIQIFDDVLEWDWFMDINFNSIRLRAETNNKSVVTLLSDQFLSYEWDPIYHLDDPIFSNWNNSEAMNIEEISSELSSSFNGTNSTILKELRLIDKGVEKAVSSSGWHLKDFRDVLKSFFQLKLSMVENIVKPMPPSSSLKPIIEDDDEDFMDYQIGEFHVESNFMDELVEDFNELEFDANLDVSGYIDDNLELLMTEREVSQRTSIKTMPPSNRCLSSIELICKASVNKTMHEIYKECLNDDNIKFSGILGKIMTLVTGTPRMKQNLSTLERSVLMKDEDSISATQSIKSEGDLSNLNEEELRESLEEVEALLKSAKRQGIVDTLKNTRSRLINLLSLISVKPGDESVSRVPTRDFLLWFRDYCGHLNEETNVLFRLTDSAYIVALRDRLDDHVEEMNSRLEIGDYELSLYRESITKPHLSTLFLDVFSNYFNLKLKVGPYLTDPKGRVDFSYP
jgi:hypothetical protein